MKYLPDSERLNYQFDPARNFGFEKYMQPNRMRDWTLVVSLTRAASIRAISGFKIYFDLEEPNRWFSSALDYHTDFEWHYVLTIDPFSHDFEAKTNGRAGRPVFIPTDIDRVARRTAVKYDIVYAGHLVSSSLVATLKSLARRFRLAVISGSKHDIVTHHGISYDEKMQVYAASRLALVHNELFPTRQHLHHLFKSLPEWREHGAFSHLSPLVSRLLPNRTRVPQLKSRLFEAAVSGAIPVVVGDCWGLAGQFLDEEWDYVASSSDTIESDVASLLADSDRENAIRLRVTEKARDLYSTQAFAQKYLTDAL